jgi:hypothetical protein
MEEKERQPDFGTNNTDHSDIETTQTQEGESQHTGRVLEKVSTETGFEPIRAGPDRRRLSYETASSLRRERSNNGWGVDDVEEDAAGGEVAPYNHPSAEDHDPYEVGWDGGDSDPLCPRSFPAWRKWLIICITSIGSFCV